MMNTLKQSKLYIWNKSWVRPYESPLSVYLNFCIINVLSYSQIKFLWGFKESLHKYFHSLFNCLFEGSSEFEKMFIEKLLPDGYMYWPSMQGEHAYCHTFRYCPKCLEQGYHSLLSQVPSEKICPIHNIEYVDSGEIYEIGMRCKYSEIIARIGRFPLPQERQHLDYAKVEKAAAKYVDKLEIAFLSLKSAHYGTGISLPESANRDMITCLNEEFFDYISFRESVWLYFSKNAESILHKKIVKSSCYLYQDRNSLKYIRNRLEPPNHSLYNDYFLPYVMIMACIYKFIEGMSENLSAYYEAIMECKDGRVIPVTDSKVRVSYCFGARGVSDENDLVNLDYLFKPNGYISRNAISNDVLYLPKIPGLVNELHINQYNTENHRVHKDLSDYLNTVISVICIHDHFWYQADKYLKSAKEKDVFDFYEEWRSLPPVIYEIDRQKSGDVYIYRIAS